MADYNHVKISKEGHVGILTMSSEPVNALTEELMGEMKVALDEIAADEDVWALIICSDKKTFAAGADLKHLVDQPRSGEVAYSAYMQDLYYKIERFRCPVIAAVGSVAFGGALEMALACDLRVCDAKAKLAFPESGLGIVPGAGATVRLTKLVGYGTAKRLIYTGEVLKCDEAYRIGLCEYTAEAGECVNKAMEIANIICSKGPIATAAIKKSIAYAVDHNIEDAIFYERNVGGDAFESDDKREGLTAFLEKREPVYKNK